MSSFTFEANLFRVGEDFRPNYPGAPVLVPKYGNSYDVNVYSEYPWTVSDDARNYIPKLLLTEYKLTYASELNAFQRSIKGFFQNLFVTTGAAAANATGGSVGFNNRRVIAENDDMLTGIGDDSDSSLTPYRGLYTAEKTGWGYVLPYLGAGNMIDINNTFEPSDAAKRLGITSAFDALGLKGASITEAGGKLSTISIGAVAGALTAETPLSFTKTSTENIKVEFYLLNTIKPEDIRKNYEFCYLFTYQNLPNRRAINILDSPPLYRATVIGYKTLPVCYIKDIKIENVGAVRLIDIGSTSNTKEAFNSVLRNTEANSSTVKMIPEAYKISFSLQSAFVNSQNMFVFAANPQGVVTTAMLTNKQRADVRAKSEKAVKEMSEDNTQAALNNGLPIF